MYISLSSTLLHWLQLALSLLDHSKPAFLSDQQPDHGSLNDLNNLGSLSPYHDAPKVPGVSVDLPGDCIIDQVILLQRHGSRGPNREQYVHKLVDTLDKAHDIIRLADLPPSLQFLKQGYKCQLVAEELTILGRKELFNNGVEFSLRYPTFSTDVVVSTTVQRVKDSAHFFGQGFFGLEAEHVTLRTTDDFDDPVSWIAPWESCPKMADHRYTKAAQWAAKYIPPIAERLNKLIPGIDFSIDTIRGALHACIYDLAARNQSPWCNVFTADELGNLEYELDLAMDSYSGHISSGDPGPLLGAFYVKKLIERLTDDSGNAKSLYLDFGHEISILLPLSTMRLNKDASPLNATHPLVDRKFRTSDQTPFGANMVWEKFTCNKTFQGPQVRLVLNRATFPLSICEKSEKDKEYGTCSLEEFVRANAYSLNIEYRNEIWDATCER